ncbi:nuclear transport factor 2 family protein [Chryseolinea lacunae]|uniref:Nuclear transport factor 2 family protein n=1 Tax=Chryseolinea lacunae TaxID=2801331 RepID=A0ABS1KLD2_9BACT|nr:nuclear transport factor 2 family protein [Chryseolinea lacunae]MBL0740268.1 nuclear transport factor 2 family protein [Chryseolinea lacunae]
MQTQLSNKERVLEFWRKAIGQGDLALAEQCIAEDYIQHSAAGKPGKAALLESLRMLQQMPKPENPPKPFVRIVADGDLVAVHMLITFGGKKMAVLDMVRLKDGMFAEHWDAVQPLTVDGKENTLVEGPVEISDLSLTAMNKNLIAEYGLAVLRGREWDEASMYFVDNFIQHDPDAGQGVKGLKAWLKNVENYQTHRVLGEGNFVVAQSSMEWSKVPFVIYDIYRLDAGKIAEHWSVKQRVPDQMPHTNGIL